MPMMTPETCPLRNWIKACGLPPDCRTIKIEMPPEDVAFASYEEPEQPGVWHRLGTKSIDIELDGDTLKIVAAKG